MHKLYNITTEDDLSLIFSELDDDFKNDSLLNKFRDDFNISKLKSIIVEYPYVDKDYRSTYYNFYAKKGLRISPFCARLHFFSERVLLTEKMTIQTPRAATQQTYKHQSANLTYCYLGFVVLRPTKITPLGRTILSPTLIKDFSGYVMETEELVHLLGHKIKINGFPFMSQHTDISVCAHVSCWSILRYYSQRFSMYAERLIHDITEMAAPTTQGGLIPSRGLNTEHAMRILSNGGCYPDLYDKVGFGSMQFYHLLYSYVESGFPVFAVMYDREHAITILGHGPIQKSKINLGTPFTYSWDFIKSLVVADDNNLPYQLIDMESQPYCVGDIDAFIVPLPEKVYFPSEAVKNYIEFLLNQQKRKLDLDFSFIQSPVIRYFLTTSSAYKRHVYENQDQIPQEILLATLELSMPKFVWIVEISDETNWAHEKVLVRFVLDATANKYETTPFFLLHDEKSVIVYDRVQSREMGSMHLSNPISGFDAYRNNLSAHN